MKETVSLVDRRRSSRGSKTRLIEAFKHHLKYTAGKHWDAATPQDLYMSLAYAVRDALVEQLIATQRTYYNRDVKRVYYLSLEYLLGRQLKNNLVNLGVYDDVREGLAELDVDLEDVCLVERDPGLGNGGLGRLAACYLDSAATQHLPVYGYGIRYEYGIFEQEIVNGWQVERPEYWLRYGTPWELVRHEYTTPIRLYGSVELLRDPAGRLRAHWKDYRTVMAVPYDVPVVGFGGRTVNMLRLWAARASESFDLDAFNRGGYVEAVQERVQSETISKVLYPADTIEAGRELRLVQQYFFVASTLVDVIRRFEKSNSDLTKLPDKMAVQLNDTHPAIAIAELMRILVDERGFEWAPAWDITCRVFNYTNHTLLPEALEKWPVAMFEKVLPRHLQIIYEINRRFLEQVRARFPDDADRLARMSLIDEAGGRSVRMANLAIVGSSRVNGVADLHTRLIRSRLVPDFAEMWPERFLNVTNGVTPRRWLRLCNPELAGLISEYIGGDWVTDLPQLARLEAYVDDAKFRARLRAVKLGNKQRMVQWIQHRLGLTVPDNALFDVQIKRLHEYKRQLLNILQVVVRYQRLLNGAGADLPPRVILFGAKAAPSYGAAKLIIKLINDVAQVINHDRRIGDKLKVVFLPNYRVSLAERIIPAADLSEQISQAGMEASGTGNMKFAMNGALTIGTLDGANIEIRDAVGSENFFLFGLTADEVERLRPAYNPWEIVQRNGEIRRALEAVRDGYFSRDEPGRFQDVWRWLVEQGDRFMLLADFDAYLEAQARVDEVWSRPDEWQRMVTLNIARIGNFSSDRSIQEYAQHIWGIAPIDPDPLPRIRRHVPRVRSQKSEV